MIKVKAAVAAFISLYSISSANPIWAQAAIVARQIGGEASSNTLTLPANTEVLLRMNDQLSTKKNREGDIFYMSVVHDVVKDGFIIIPKGSKAVGEVTWRTGKGAFGKSGKMDIKLNYVELSGQRVPLVGTFRQEGDGNTVATVGGVIAAGVFAAFITGKSGVVPAGRELSVHTLDDLVVALPESAAPPKPAITATAVLAVTPQTESEGADEVRQSGMSIESDADASSEEGGSIDTLVDDEAPEPVTANM